MNWLTVIVLLVGSNFFYQLWKKDNPDWNQAAERSWIQITTIVIVILIKPWTW